MIIILTPNPIITLTLTPITGSRSAEKYGDAGFFQAWACFEIRELQELERRKDTIMTSDKRDEILILINKLFKKAISVNKYHSASWVAWAKHEQRLGNIDQYYYYYYYYY